MTQPAVCIAANVRIPSERANSLQTVCMAAAFQELGLATTVLHARRYPQSPQGTTQPQEGRLPWHSYGAW